MRSGTLYWITGLSGAGKTTIGKALSDQSTVAIMTIDRFNNEYTET